MEKEIVTACRLFFEDKEYLKKPPEHSQIGENTWNVFYIFDKAFYHSKLKDLYTYNQWTEFDKEKKALLLSYHVEEFKDIVTKYINNLSDYIQRIENTKKINDEKLDNKQDILDEFAATRSVARKMLDLLEKYIRNNFFDTNQEFEARKFITETQLGNKSFRLIREPKDAYLDKEYDNHLILTRQIGIAREYFLKKNFTDAYELIAKGLKGEMHRVVLYPESKPKKVIRSSTVLPPVSCPLPQQIKKPNIELNPVIVDGISHVNKVIEIEKQNPVLNPLIIDGISPNIVIEETVKRNFDLNNIPVGTVLHLIKQNQKATLISKFEENNNGFGTIVISFITITGKKIEKWECSKNGKGFDGNLLFYVVTGVDAVEQKKF